MGDISRDTRDPTLSFTLSVSVPLQLWLCVWVSVVFCFPLWPHTHSLSSFLFSVSLFVFPILFSSLSGSLTPFLPLYDSLSFLMSPVLFFLYTLFHMSQSLSVSPFPSHPRYFCLIFSSELINRTGFGNVVRLSDPTSQPDSGPSPGTPQVTGSPWLSRGSPVLSVFRGSMHSGSSSLGFT